MFVLINQWLPLRRSLDFQRLRVSIQPSIEWGPAKIEHKRKWMDMKQCQDFQSKILKLTIFNVVYIAALQIIKCPKKATTSYTRDSCSWLRVDYHHNKSDLVTLGLINNYKKNSIFCMIYLISCSFYICMRMV